MTNPKRLLVTCDSELERTLLRAGRAGAPEGARERALVVASTALAASGVAAVGGMAAGQASAGLKIGFLAAIKWIGVLSLASVGVAAGAAIVHHARSQTAASPKVDVTPLSSSVLHRAAPAGAQSASSFPATSAVSELAPAPPAPSHGATASSPPTATARSAPRASESSGSTLPAELVMLERARAAMAAGELSRARSILDSYIDRFPHGAMAPEAAVLRIEALLKAGDRAAATRFANAFLAIDPRSPYAVRIQSLLSASSPSP